ncbi:MAG TPA: hypothetical protein VEI26_09640 [Terriglobales bacterium]|nr:hypothetical protein [Terriglobales bacterium]
MKSKVAESKKPESEVKSPSVCIICGKPATRKVDGDPSCEEHVELVYQDQLEKYTQQHMGDRD